MFLRYLALLWVSYLERQATATRDSNSKDQVLGVSEFTDFVDLSQIKAVLLYLYSISVYNDLLLFFSGFRLNVLCFR